MISNPTAIAGLVAREVHTGTRDGAPTRIIVARRTYSTDQSDLWDALTNAERLPRWFLPITGDLTVGGHYQLEGNAGGVVEQCNKPESFAITWEMGDQISWVRVRLSPNSNGTALELSHEAPEDPEFWAQYGPGAGGAGWDLALMGLGLHLSSGKSVDPNEAIAFSTSPVGIEFVKASATWWADAAIADGDDPDQARAAAERTIAFYTTMPEDESHD
ncbi:SRPBCC family protein [Hoyosella rhizosphaerae]|uniref:Activator of HSP90 ATPase n=1 Tax=Hoyosella rhizosphaerae TaxID=1755582 RepID=A0A916X7X3_9ACTN|nr:SRPBCC family protein [Hoyosella rhizosphaerae]GGC53148.1 activator of HSP90 ATPase [Hoyosella rhizosphaerae]